MANQLLKDFPDDQPSVPDQDLGLGFKVSQEQKSRFINRDGTFNVSRTGVFGRGSFSLYHAILAMSWPVFYSWIFALFVLANIIFAGLYLLTGPAAFPDLVTQSTMVRSEQLFLYSVQILTTLGASPLHPVASSANIILGLEAGIGLLGFATATALLFARFSNPATKIIFSDRAVIAPYKNINGFMLRVINGRSNELIEVTASITLALTDGDGKRKFQQLPLERDMVLVFPLNWTIVHPIDNASPLWGLDAADLAAANAEFLIAITAFDKDLSKKVYARSSYLFDEVVMGARFATMIRQASDGSVVADSSLIHKIENA